MSNVKDAVSMYLELRASNVKTKYVLRATSEQCTGLKEEEGAWYLQDDIPLIRML